MRPPERLVLPNGSSVLLVGIVRGLVEDREALERLLAAEAWDAVGVGCSPERWEELAARSDAVESDLLASRYLHLLGRWGAAEDPDRWLSGLKASCEAQGVAAKPIDLSDNRYAERATALISGWALARQALALRRLRRRRMSVATAEEFAARWERAASPGAGFRALEAEREAVIAQGILRLAEGPGPQRILAAVEAERCSGVLTRLRGLIGEGQP